MAIFLPQRKTSSGTETVQFPISSINGLSTALDGKQSSLSTAQLNAVNSGITSAKVSTYDGYASGKTNSSVVPNNSGEIKTKFRCSQKGYTGGSSTYWYYKLCTLPADNTGNYASAIISGRIGGWCSDNMSYINALVWNRDSTGIALMDIAGTATAMSSVWNICDLLMYVNTDNTATLYAKCYGYFVFDLDIELFQSSASLTYDGTYVTSVSDTLSAQASTTTKRVEIVGGKLLVNGSAVAMESAIPSFTANNPTLAWGTTSTIGTAGGTTFKVTMPANPNTDTGATSVAVSGSGNAVTTASYDASTRKLTLTKGTTFVSNVTATAGTNINSVGTPSVTASTSNGVTTLTFNYLKGAAGTTGVGIKSITITES